MTFILSRHLAQKLGVSERTLYNYRKKLKGKFTEENRNGKLYLEPKPFFNYAESIGILIPKPAEEILESVGKESEAKQKSKLETNGYQA
jgi:intergrase/recombinase